MLALWQHQQPDAAAAGQAQQTGPTPADQLAWPSVTGVGMAELPERKAARKLILRARQRTSTWPPPRQQLLSSGMPQLRPRPVRHLRTQVDASHFNHRSAMDKH